MYYLGSRFYDTEICRFINADDLDYLGASGDFIGYNLYAYCANNPVNCKDEIGAFTLWVSVAVVAIGAIVGAGLGALSAAASDGDIGQSMIKGAITGAIGSMCGLLPGKAFWGVVLAGITGAGVEYRMQLMVQYEQYKTMDPQKVDLLSCIYVGAQTALGTAIPGFGNLGTQTLNAIGTALVWAEGATVIASADIVGNNIRAQNSNGRTNNSNIGCRAPAGMTVSEYRSYVINHGGIW